MNQNLTENEAQALYDAADELYDMYIEAADYVIENDLFFDLGIPFNLVETIKKSWENDVHWHIYGAFKLAGGINNQAIKLLGFDADTPKGLYETSEEQLDANQFNEVHEKITTNFKRLITLDDDIDNFDDRYDGWKILFSAPSDDAAKERTSRMLQAMAQEAGFETSFSYLHEVVFGEDGISDENGVHYEYWFKNYKWLDMATDENELATTLTSIMNEQQAIILNPAYTLLFESRGMLKILKDLYPDSPYLMKSSFEAFDGSLSKTVFGDTEEYSNFKTIYLENIDPEYEARVFFAYEACGLNFVNRSGKFVGHKIV